VPRRACANLIRSNPKKQAEQSYAGRGMERFPRVEDTEPDTVGSDREDSLHFWHDENIAQNWRGRVTAIGWPARRVAVAEKHGQNGQFMQPAFFLE